MSRIKDLFLATREMEDDFRENGWSDETPEDWFISAQRATWDAQREAIEAQMKAFEKTELLRIATEKAEAQNKANREWYAKGRAKEAKAEADWNRKQRAKIAARNNF